MATRPTRVGDLVNVEPGVSQALRLSAHAVPASITATAVSSPPNRTTRRAMPLQLLVTQIHRGIQRMPEGKVITIRQFAGQHHRYARAA